MPAINPTGTKIDNNTNVVATIALPICCIAFTDAA